MPLNAVIYHVTTHNSVIESSLQLTYINDSPTKIEAVLEMPNNPDLVIAKLRIKVGETEIEAKVQEKQKAKEKYEDAVAGGH